MTNYANYQLPASVLDACSELRELLNYVEDVSLDAVCQTRLGCADYDGQPDPETIATLANRVAKIAKITDSLIRLTTFEERRAIEEQNLLPWRFAA